MLNSNRKTIVFSAVAFLLGALIATSIAFTLNVNEVKKNEQVAKCDNIAEAMLDEVTRIGIQRDLAKLYKEQREVEYPDIKPITFEHLSFIADRGRELQESCGADPAIQLKNYISKRLQEIQTPADINDEQEYSLSKYAFDVVNSVNASR